MSQGPAGRWVGVTEPPDDGGQLRAAPPPAPPGRGWLSRAQPRCHLCREDGASPSGPRPPGGGCSFMGVRTLRSPEPRQPPALLGTTHHRGHPGPLPGSPPSPGARSWAHAPPQPRTPWPSGGSVGWGSLVQSMLTWRGVGGQVGGLRPSESIAKQGRFCGPISQRRELRFRKQERGWDLPRDTVGAG